MTRGREFRIPRERLSETQPQLARDHRRREGLTERDAMGEDWLGYAIAVCMVLLFMILVGVLPVGQ